ncbi:hypothetical protein VNI00_019065 [Paramarasmius palmivorus]|uniref:Uncharacterized protein n=1 Tax=Paramarasmius palmivorus TaxID=297713 RepID=A0AAW0ARU9_9AGAR
MSFTESLQNALHQASISHASTSQPTTLPPAYRDEVCYGVTVSWAFGSILSNYLWAMYDMQKMGWEPVGFDRPTNSLIYRSDHCKGKEVSHVDHHTPRRRIGDGSSIPTCRRYRRLLKRMEAGPKKHTPYRHLTPNQAYGIMARMNERAVRLTSKIQALERRARLLEQKIDDYSRILILLAKNDVVALRRLLAVALRRGASVHAILSRINDSLNGLYSVKGGYTKRDLDKAFLAKALGGSRLLYALTKSEGYASSETLRRHFKSPKLRPSLSTPTREEIDININKFFDPSLKSPKFTVSERCPSLPGNILMFDGIALETKCRYCTERDAVMGLCREHSKNVDLNVSSINNVEQIRHALFDENTHQDSSKKVCFGSDGTVVAVAPYARTDFYSPVPIVLSPSCKEEKGEQLAEWLQTTLDAWKENPCGERVHGPIWSIGSDGDSVFRRAKYDLCMTTPIDPTSNLGERVCPLLGMNTLTSSQGVVGTCDPKHILKRFATLLRSPEGITIGDLTTTRDDVLFSLEEIGIPHDRALRLLDPADKQNVPKATSLLQELFRVVGIDRESLTPSQLRRRTNISFLSTMLNYFLEPFVTNTLSLSDQIFSLSVFSHLAAALQTMHGSACLTGALYADTQSVIKNIIITTARLQLIDPDLPFYIIHEGTDRLEGLFADVRTQDHARNVDVDQLAQKLSVSAQIQAIFEQNPDMDRGHRRVGTTGSLGPDHLNPKSWKGDVRVGTVDLKEQWDAGQLQARHELQKYLGITFDFYKLYKNPSTDLLRPNGDYVGTRKTTDDLRSEREETSLEEADKTLSDFEDSEDLPIGVDIDDFIPGPANDDSGKDASRPVAFQHDKVLTVKGKQYLKGSIVAALCSDRTRKVTMRTLRARGVTLEDLNRRSNPLKSPESSLEGGDLIKAGDIGAGLVRCGKAVSLAVFEIMGFRHKTQKSLSTSIPANTLEDVETAPSVVGQILEMETAVPEDGGDMTWDWTGKYLKPDETHEGLVTRRRLVVEFPGRMVFPLAPTVVPNIHIQQTITWSVDHRQLMSTMTTAMSEVFPDDGELMKNISSIPIVNNSALPYSGTDALSFAIPENASAKDPDSVVMCPLECEVEVSIRKLRSHVGRHVLHSLRKGKEQDGCVEVGIDPCGWCGMSGTCITQLIQPPSGSVKVESNCTYRYERMRYDDAAKSTRATPCTNVPIHCPLCPKSISGQPVTIWKYNAIDHILINHAEPNARIRDVDGALAADIFISLAEEKAMGIETEATKAYREDHGIPDSDVVMEYRETRKRTVTQQDFLV